MENLAECLRWTLRLRLALECGDSVRVALKRERMRTPFDTLIHDFVFCVDQRGDLEKLFDHLGTYERALFELIRAGLSGNKIYERVLEYEKELTAKCLDEIQKEIDLLPFKLMVPVLLFQFPAYLLLILGPIIQKFIESLGG